MKKVITIHQPWAWLIINGHKDIENRTWHTIHRGTLLIHAGKTKKYYRHYQAISNHYNIELPNPDRLLYGCILGEVQLVDVITDSISPWAFSDHYHWVVESPVKYEKPIFVRGNTGLWSFHR